MDVTGYPASELRSVITILARLSTLKSIGTISFA